MLQVGWRVHGYNLATFTAVISSAIVVVVQFKISNM